MKEKKIRTKKKILNQISPDPDSVGIDFFGVRPRLHEQIKHTLFAQIRPELLHRD